MLRGASKIDIYVGNLSLETTQEQLRLKFAAFGEVISVTMMNDDYIGSGQPRGYGYVRMASRSESQTAITSLNGKEVGGRVVRVIEALPLSDNRGTGFFDIKRSRHFNVKTRQRKY